MTEIFKVNIGLVPELMNDVLEFIKERIRKNELCELIRNSGHMIQATKYDIQTKHTA